MSESENQGADYLKRLGRDGAYVEIPVAQIGDELIRRSWTGEPWPSHIVVTSSRFDITDPALLGCLKRILSHVESLPETSGMEAGQIGVYAFNQIFKAGLIAMGGEAKAEPQQAAAGASKPLVKYGS